MKHTSRLAVAATGVAAAVALVGVGATAAAAKHGGKIEADGFVGVPASLTGTPGNFAGLPGGGVPWSIGEAEVKVARSGKVEVEFTDLVFAAGPNVGKNTVANMRVGVSCMALDLTRTVALSDQFPVTVAATATDGVGGDADAVTRIALPPTCAAPIVFITNPAGAWFAVEAL